MILREVCGAATRKNILVCKGAVDKVISQCTKILTCDNTTNAFNVIRNLNSNV